ncbi:MAG: DNA methyltransferase, partial [Planctomycetota bacterium]|nr:DNA methyltransferase [Planctomycetota bacterium]
CLRVLKPGGHLVAFGGTRTVHRLACAIEDAGLEIRDTIAWVQFQGFPKSLDVSKAIDRAAGAEREVVGRQKLTGTARRGVDGSSHGAARTNAADQKERQPTIIDLTAPATEDARTWEGFGTALKPAHEPAILARKPLVGTVAANVLAHGTGALNIDGCRFAYGDPAWPGPGEDTSGAVFSSSTAWAPGSGSGTDTRGDRVEYRSDLGRWPANLYACPKPSRAEREAGCERLPGRTGAEATDRTEGTAGLDSPRAGAGRTAGRVYGMKRCEICGRQAVNVSGTCQCPEPRWVDVGRTQGGVKNHHPTVKPLGVMRWLVKLVGGHPGRSVILDPFMGSGTTGCAAMLEGFDFIGIEREPEYIQIAEARIRHHLGALFAHGVQVIETDEGAA